MGRANRLRCRPRLRTFGWAGHVARLATVWGTRGSIGFRWFICPLADDLRAAVHSAGPRAKLLKAGVLNEPRACGAAFRPPTPSAFA